MEGHSRFRFASAKSSGRLTLRFIQCDRDGLSIRIDLDRLSDENRHEALDKLTGGGAGFRGRRVSRAFSPRRRDRRDS